jgi:hypothetical protein
MASFFTIFRNILTESDILTILSVLIGTGQAEEKGMSGDLRWISQGENTGDLRGLRRVRDRPQIPGLEAGSQWDMTAAARAFL